MYDVGRRVAVVNYRQGREITARNDRDLDRSRLDLDARRWEGNHVGHMDHRAGAHTDDVGLQRIAVAPAAELVIHGACIGRYHYTNRVAGSQWPIENSRSGVIRTVHCYGESRRICGDDLRYARVVRRRQRDAPDCTANTRSRKPNRPVRARYYPDAGRVGWYRRGIFHD